jgi:hypothetical protein
MCAFHEWRPRCRLLLPPSGGSTQVETTPGVGFRAVVGLDGELQTDMVL